MSDTTSTKAIQILGWYREGSFPALFTDSVAVVKQWLEQGHKVSGVIRHDGLAVEAAPNAPAAGDALPTIKGAAITGGYVVVTPAGWGEDKAQKVRDAILRLFPVNPAYTPKPEDAHAQQQGEA